MQKIAFYLFVLLFITACQVVKMPKKPLKAEQVILSYFLDSLVPNDPHLKGREFEFDFVVRQGIGYWEPTSYPKVSNWRYVLAYEVEDSVFKDEMFLSGKENFKAPAPIRLKRIKKIKKIKYENKSKFFHYNYFDIPHGIDTSKVDFSRTNKGTIYLGSQYTELPNGSFYTISQLQIIYIYKGKLYDKSYYFVLRNNIIKYLSLYTSNHRENYGKGINVYLITPRTQK